MLVMGPQSAEVENRTEEMGISKNQYMEGMAVECQNGRKKEAWC